MYEVFGNYMKGEPNSARVFRILSRFWEAPLELRIFAICSLLVTVLSISLVFFGPEYFYRSIVPFTGGVPLGYMFGLYFTFALIFERVPPVDSRPLFLPGMWKPWVWNFANWIQKRKAARPYAGLRFGIVGPLIIQIFSGYMTWMMDDGNDHGNPYLRVSPWQPFWTMVIPALWILVLHLPRMNKFFHRPAELPEDLTMPVGDGQILA